MEKHGGKILESDFRRWVGQQFKNAGWFFQSIETTTKAGVPDVYAVEYTRCKAFWLELKVGDKEEPLIRKEQRVWALQHYNCGGVSYLAYLHWASATIRLYEPPYLTVRTVGRYLALEDPYESVPIKQFVEFLRSKLCLRV
jgi:hypothetical protein